MTEVFAQPDLGLDLYSQGMKDMSDLIVVGFSDTEKADRALTKMVSFYRTNGSVN